MSIDGIGVKGVKLRMSLTREEEEEGEEQKGEKERTSERREMSEDLLVVGLMKKNY